MQNLLGLESKVTTVSADGKKTMEQTWKLTSQTLWRLFNMTNHRSQSTTIENFT